MATSTVQDLKAKQKEAALAFNKINEDPQFQQLRANVQTAWNNYKDLDPNAPDYAEKQAAYEQANAAYAPLYKEQQNYKAQYETYTAQISSTAEIQTTSPTPTPEQQTEQATQAGNQAATTTNPTPPPSSSNITPPTPFVPSDDNPLPNDSDPNFIAAPRPTNPSSQRFISDDEIAEINATVNANPESQRTSSDFAGNFIAADVQATQEQNAITAAGDVGNFQAADAAATAAANLKPEEQIVVTSPGDVATLDLTQSQSQADDPLGDKIKEIQATNSQISTLPNRQQLSGTGSPKDWRFRMSLAPSANYLYKDSSPGILKPLQATNGVIFPYSPSITVNYTASYNSSDLTHTNFKIYNYKSSSVESINIVGDFTAQDSSEANYVLAVIHFFKSVTKMFYGQDQNPVRGTPPPLVYLTGFGQYQFDMHPVVVTSFTHTFPTDVDYVNAYPTNNSVSIGGQNMEPYMPQIAQFISPLDRLRTLSSKIRPGGTAPPPTFINSKNINEVTRVPAKITIQLSCLPVVTRNAISNSFSLKKYASGELMRGSVNFGRTGGGVW